MAKQEEFYEEFLDDLEIDIDFDSKNKKLIAKTSESHYREEFELPTLTQLLNHKSDEFIHAILIDTNPRIEVSIENMTEYSDREEYSVEIKMETSISLTNVDLTRLFFNAGELTLTLDGINEIKTLLKENKFILHPNSTDSSALYILKIINIDQLNNILRKFEQNASPHKSVNTFDDLGEKAVVSFKKFQK